ncbi:MAG: MFS transporter [Myxococcaceae bacterium]
MTSVKSAGNEGEPRKRGALGVLFLVVFLDLLGFGILIPQLGVYAVRFEASPFLVGMLLSVYSLMQFLFAPVLGGLSDRVGRRPVLLYSIAGSAFGYVLFGLAQSLTLLFISRIIDGISGANVSTAQAYVADVTSGEQRAKGMGIIGAGFGLGFILGPAIGGYLGAQWGNAGIGFFAAGLAALNWVLALFLLPESRSRGLAARAPRSLRSIANAFTLPVVGLSLLLFFAVTTAFSQMEGTFSVFLIDRYLVGGAQALGEARPEVIREASLMSGHVFVAVGVVSALVQGGLIGRLRARFGEENLVIAGAVLLIVGLAGVPASPTYGWIFLPMALLAAGSGLVQPCLSALVSIAAPADRQGEVMGAYQAMGSLGRIIGPILGGFFFGALGSAAPYLTAAAVMVVSLGLAVGLRRRVLARPRSGS